MIIDPNDLDNRRQYRLLIDLVIPRPIAWVSTVDEEGQRNLAPFSFFNGVSGAPPIIMIAIGQRKGKPKDTLANIEATKEFVVNLVQEKNAEPMNLTSGEYPPEIDEFEVAGLTPLPSERVRPPRVAQSDVNLECRLVQTVPVPDSATTLVLGRVVLFHLSEVVLTDGRPDPAKLKPLGRLGADEYAPLGNILKIPRPGPI